MKNILMVVCAGVTFISDKHLLALYVCVCTAIIDICRFVENRYIRRRKYSAWYKKLINQNTFLKYNFPSLFLYYYYFCFSKRDNCDEVSLVSRTYREEEALVVYCLKSLFAPAPSNSSSCSNTRKCQLGVLDHETMRATILHYL